MKIIKWTLSAVAALILAALIFFFGYMRPRHVVPILMYHGVDEVEGSSLYVRPDVFADQIRFLRDSGYNVIDLDTFVKAGKTGRPLEDNSVVITFDDGLEDNYINAFPVLSRYDMPATIFLITGYIGREPGYLNWDQVRVMSSHGISFGAHTRDNVYLPSISGDKEKLKEQIYAPRKDIAENAGLQALYFCYPTGGFNDTIKDMVRKAGYRAACATNRGYDRYNEDLYELNRVKITNSDTTKPFHFRAKLSGYYNLFRSYKAPE
ncbi:MAG: polysaccharide deacetylase family protein [Candidatus Omnitrophica bacterium]|nr:polysaccharide deacetylase family protein [Candidatus Omnitrophota bacterium]